MVIKYHFCWCATGVGGGGWEPGVAFRALWVCLHFRGGCGRGALVAFFPCTRVQPIAVRLRYRLLGAVCCAVSAPPWCAFGASCRYRLLLALFV